MAYAVDTESVQFLPGGPLRHLGGLLSSPPPLERGRGPFRHRDQGHPGGVVGKATKGDPRKARRPLVAIMRYMTLVQDEILAAFPAGKLPPTDKVSLRDPEELAPYLKEPFSSGWKSVLRDAGGGAVVDVGREPRWTHEDPR